MSESETLFSIAQVAIGLAGFSAIVVGFKRLESGDWHRADADRFNGMLIHAMCAALFCVLPSILAPFAPSASALWTLASALIGLQIAVHAGLVLTLSSTDLAGRIQVGGFAAAVVLLQASNVLGVGFDHAFGPYLVGVLWHVIQAGVLFVMMTFVRAADIRDDSRD